MRRLIIASTCLLILSGCDATSDRVASATPKNSSKSMVFMSYLRMIPGDEVCGPLDARQWYILNTNPTRPITAHVEISTVYDNEPSVDKIDVLVGPNGKQVVKGCPIVLANPLQRFDYKIISADWAN